MKYHLFTKIEKKTWESICDKVKWKQMQMDINND